MWYPVKIWAKNVFSFSEIEHSFARGVTTTIVGVNRDDLSQGGNGSGKSALIEVLAIATTGSPLRKVNIDEVISDSADRAVVGVIYRQTDSTKELKIERKFSRKDSSTANAEVYGSLGLIASSDTGIDACNEFIFSHLGVSKDEIFSNFILSKYKYKNFLSVSDNEKKAIINRFSNGVLVDQAIESLLVDKIECLKNQRDIEIKFHESKAKCEAISSQIEENESLREDKIQKNQEQIQSKKEELSIQRSLKRELSLKLKDHSLKIAEAKNLFTELNKIDKETSELSAKETAEAIDSFWSKHFSIPPDGKGYGYEIDMMKVDFEKSCDEVASIEAEIHELQTDANESANKISKLESDYKTLLASKEAKAKELGDMIEKLRQGVIQMHKECDAREDEIAKINKRNREISNILSGAITCPNCNHKFLIDNNADIDSISSEKEKNLSIISEKNNEIERISSQALRENGVIKSLKAQESDLENIGKDVLALSIAESKNQNEILDKISRMKRRLSEISLKKDAFESKISRLIDDAFEETENEIDSIVRSLEKYKMEIERDANTLAMKIEQIEFAIEALEKFDPDSTLPDLKDRLSKYTSEMNDIDKLLIKSQAEVDKFTFQENIFSEFKTHLANSKIDALSEITNGFLELIGSDLRVEFQGFKLLKSGKIRDKITVNLLRNGIEVGSFGKLSVGESARINLACILAMNKLINVNCDDNKGLDLLVLDEILEGIDEAGLSSVLSALNKIGVTSIVVSQLGIAETNDNVVVVIKENGESRID